MMNLIMKWRRVALMALGLAAAGTTQAQDCDRSCLENTAERYLESLTSNRPGILPMTMDVRMTENGQDLQVGDGLWATARRRGNYTLFFSDEHSQQVALFATLYEHENLVLLSARLALENGEVSEIEALVGRQYGSDVGTAVEALAKPNSLWANEIPRRQRMSREALITVANKYFEGLENNDGKGDYPFTDDCNRLENGNQVTNNPDLQFPTSEEGQALKIPSLGCREQFELGYFASVTRIRDRRFPVVDVERGVVFTSVFFDHSGAVREAELTNGMTVPFNLKRPFTWALGEAFKIENEQIRFIEAVLTEAPYGMTSGWE